MDCAVRLPYSFVGVEGVTKMWVLGRRNLRDILPAILLTLYSLLLILRFLKGQMGC